MPDLPTDTGPWTQYQPPAPPDASGPWAQYQPPPQQQPFSGGFLPFSKDTQGQVSVDPNAGFLGGIQQLAKATTVPGKIYSGAISTPYSGSGSTEPSPEVFDAARTLALSFSPTSVAARAGSIVPGMAATAQVPTAQELKAAGSAGYNAARASPVTVPADDIANMAQGVQQTLQNTYGIIPKTAPNTYAILDELANPPKVASSAGAAEIRPNPPGFDVHTNGPAGVLYADTMTQAQDMANRFGLGASGNAVVGTYSGLEAARRGLSAIGTGGGAEGLAAQKAIPELDKFIDRISPEAATARANYAAAQRSNDLTGTLDRANTGILEQAEARAAASHSGTNLDNATRQRVASFLQNPSNLSGFSDSEIDALNNLVKGSPAQNVARTVGNYLGAGRGFGGLAATASGAVLGGHLGGAEGTALGLALPTAIGSSAKSLENALARRALNNVDEMVRSRSPLAESMSSQMIPSTGLNNAYQRSPLLMALRPQQPQPQPFRGPLPLSQASPSSLAEIMAKRAPYY